MATSLANIIANKMQSFRIFQGFIPKMMPKCLSVTVDLTGTILLTDIDLEISKLTYTLEFVQMVFIDNSLSGQPFTLKNTILGHSITLLAGHMAYLPMPSPPDAKFEASVPGAALGLIKVIFFNVAMPAVVWEAS